MQKKLSARIIRMFAVVAACALCLCFFACGNKTEPSGPATGDPPDSDYDDPYVVALRVVTEPQKKEYIAGESFDPSGMTLAADWSHGITEDLFATECEISPSEPLTEDVTELVFKYEGRTCTQEIKVTANDIIAFTVNRDAIGEVEPTGLLDLSQIKVSAEYLDGSKTDVVDYEICEKATQGVIAEPNSYMLTEGEHVFVVKYRNESAEFSVVGKDLSHGWPSEASESYVGGKENTITIYKNTAGAIKTNSEQGEVTGALTADQTITGLNSAAVGGAPFVEYTFTTADNVWVDIDWAISSASGAISDLGANPEMLAFVQNYTDMGFFSIILFLFIGAILTMIVQASAATMAITLIMCANGWIDYHLGVALVLGENIGTTITANLAALTGNTQARRAALAHLVFNVFGVMWVLVLFYPFTNAVSWFVTHVMKVSDPAVAVSFKLAAFHTAFNISNTFIMIWFVSLIEKTVCTLIKPKVEDEEYRLRYITGGMLSTAELSILQAHKEISLFAERTARMFNMVKELFYEKNEETFLKT